MYSVKFKTSEEIKQLVESYSSSEAGFELDGVQIDSTIIRELSESCNAKIKELADEKKKIGEMSK